MVNAGGTGSGIGALYASADSGSAEEVCLASNRLVFIANCSHRYSLHFDRLMRAKVCAFHVGLGKQQVLVGRW